MRQLKTDLELELAYKAGITIYAKRTGPFGEDEGATVQYYGPVKDSYDLEFDEDTMSEDDFLEDFDEDTIVIILDTTIGQSSQNFYVDDGGWSVEDLDLYIDD